MLKLTQYLALIGLLSTSVALANTDCPTAPNLGASITTPTSDFILQGPVAIHKPTGLMWQRCMVGEVLDDNKTPSVGTDDFCKEMPRGILDNETLSLSTLEIAGYSDWRVPNIKELYSIQEECPTNEGHLVNLTVFPISPEYRIADKIPLLWASTNVIMTKQLLYPSTNNANVGLRLVRDVIKPNTLASAPIAQ